MPIKTITAKLPEVVASRTVKKSVMQKTETETTKGVSLCNQQKRE